MGREIVVGLHFYQPPREATHPELFHISTDPENKNWTEIIEKQCYEPLALEGVLQKASYDIYQSLLIQLEKIDPTIADIFQKSMKENGVGEAFIHPILPNLSYKDKHIVISSGVKRFKEISGVAPKIFWPPETAIDTETLEVLALNGYQGFICAPEQIIQRDGKNSDNQPTIITLKNNRQIIAIPFDRPISSRLAFDPKQNADAFVNSFIKPKLDLSSTNQTIIAWTDAETFGHHFRFGDKFLRYLLESSLPGNGLYPVSINSLHLDTSRLPHGKIHERSSWSCPHQNLIRWGGICPCGDDEDKSWKKPYSNSLNYLNHTVSDILQANIGNGYEKLVSDSFYTHYAHPETVNNPLRALVAAKISSLIAQTSCATFFSSPEVSGKINLLYAYQTLLYLKEAGLTKQYTEIADTLFEKLSHVHYPGSEATALTTLWKMLNR